jgi:superfamily II DNA or RNA helicase
MGTTLSSVHHFARNKSMDVTRIPWDLVVIDEAHHLRNVYKKSNKIANELRDALKGFDKLLLTGIRSVGLKNMAI